MEATGKPRLCNIKKAPDFNGYGFNLHARPGQPGQFIGQVEPNSPADHAGLRRGDRVVEVNGVNVELSSHSQVVALVKDRPNDATVLVVDEQTDAYYKGRGVPITEQLLHDLQHPVEAAPHPNGEVQMAEPEPEPEPEAEPDMGAQVAEAVQIIETLQQPAEDVPKKTPQTPVLKPRLCVLHKRANFVGYGFNLQSRPGLGGQYISKVDQDSPAEEAGLHVGDHLLEVNGFKLENESHTQVVNRIKQNPNEVKLLVVDEATEAHYLQHGLPLSLTEPNESHSSHVSVSTQELESEVQKAHTETIMAEPADVADVDSPSVPEPAAPPPVPVAASVPVTSPDPPPEIAPVAAAPRVQSDRKSTAPKPRQCVLTKMPGVPGYGFSMHAEKGRSGQFIGQIDRNSPAEAAGLREFDKLIEVNGKNVENESHAQVVTLIKQMPNQVTLLVADMVTEAYYRDRDIKITRLLLDDVSDSTDSTVQTERSNGAQRVAQAQPSPSAGQRNSGMYAASGVQSGAKSAGISVSAAEHRENLHKNNPRVRVKQTDKSFRDRSAAFDNM